MLSSEASESPEPTRRLILGTAGHIDHGKTALVRALTGVDTDRLPEEKKRGVTIDLGFAHLDLPGLRLGIVDVPGHERFVKNMLAGAAGIDAALLVVAADDAVMPQTREHLAILDLLGVPRGVIALTKTDLSDPDWVDLVEQDVRELAQGTPLERAPIVRTSATTGAGIEELRAALADVCAHAPAPSARGWPFRMSVDRVFTRPGRGTVVTGAVASGQIRLEDALELLPRGERVRVRGLQSHGEDVEQVGPGTRVAINLKGVDADEVQRGDVLATPGYLKPARRITIRLRALPDAPWPIRHRSRLRLHAGAQEVMATVRLLRGTSIEPGESAPAQLICAEPTALVGGQPVVVRAESPLVTVGGGRVLVPTNRAISRRKPEQIERLADLLADDGTTRADAAAFFLGAARWTALDLAREAGLSAPESEGAIAALVERERLLDLALSSHEDALRIHADAAAPVTRRIERVLRRLHEESPLEPAVPVGRLRREFRYVDEDVFLALIGRMLGEGRLAGDADAVASPDFAPALSGAQREAVDAVLAVHREAGFSPPVAADLAAHVGLDENALAPVLELCAQRGELVRIGGAIHLHRDRVDEMIERVTAKLGEGDSMTVSEIRDLLGTSRKYAVPICEYLDRIGVTARRGDQRVLGRAARVRAGASPGATDGGRSGEA